MRRWHEVLRSGNTVLEGDGYATVPYPDAEVRPGPS
jgi:hypothetical protein